MKTTIDEMEKRLEYLREIAEKAKKELDELPQGSLRICRSRGHVQFYHFVKGKGGTLTYIRKSEEDLIRGLAQRDYLERVLRAISKEIKAIETYLSKMPDLQFESVYDQMCGDKKKLTPSITESDDQFVANWANGQHEKKEIDVKSAVYVTEKGDYVHSKSELIIANMLHKYGILYIYECGLYLGGRLVYPDFTLLDVKNRRLIYWEHFGMMSNPDYARKAVKKINDYEENGFVLGETLIVSFEAKSQPLDIGYLRRIIERLAAVAAKESIPKSA